MSAPEASWPALAGRAPAGLLAVERGVWGKAHGAASDFRWLARSAGFSAGEMARRLGLGPEDRPARATFWLSLGAHCYAGAIYPSRAVDAAGRQGSLEKQVLEWARPAALPAAIGALALLPRAAQLDDGVWWERRGDAGWLRPDFALPIDPLDVLPAGLSERQAAEVIARGVAALSKLVSEAALGELYAQLLCRHRPALLSDLRDPLPAEALAVLLLPLPSELANRLSFAGWMPSSRLSLAELSSWDLVGLPPSVASPPPPASGPDAARQGAAMARALLAGDPALLAGSSPVLGMGLGRRADAPAKVPAGGHGDAGSPLPPAPIAEPSLPSRPVLRLPLTPPPAGAGPVLRALHAFAVDPNRRWLDPQALPTLAPLAAGDPAEGVLLGWIEELGRLRGDADPEQWAVKIDLLRSAALAMAPALATGTRTVLPTSGRVPALLFTASCGARGYSPLLELEAAGWLPMALEQSLLCRTDALRRRVRRWLEQARAEPRLRTIQPRIRDALVQYQEATAAGAERI